MDNQPDHGSRGHAEFSPSSLKYVASCPGYKGREGTNAAAEKGTRIHEALEVRDPSALHDEEELQIYEQICKDEEAFMKEIIGDEEYVEHNEMLTHVQLNGTSTWGTCDRLILYGDKAIMGDYKTGISVIDSPRDNWQAKAYALGAFQKFKDIQEITFVFYVPVRHEVLHDVFKRDEMPDMTKELSWTILEGERVRPQWEYGTPAIEDINPTVNCRFCAFEAKCPALGAIAIEVAQRVADHPIPDTDIDDPDDMATLEQLWAIAKIVTNWATRIKAKAILKAKEGEEFPSLRLKSMGATKKCNDNQKLMEIAKAYDMPDEELLTLATFPLQKVATAVSKRAPDGEKGQVKQDFLDSVSEADIVDVSEKRYTLT